MFCRISDKRGEYVSEKIPELYETEEIPLEKKMIYQKWDIEEIGFYWLIAEQDRRWQPCTFEEAQKKIREYR